MLRTIDPAVPEVVTRIVEIQRAAYAIEAGLIGFDGIPQLFETEDEVRELGHMCWTGAFVEDLLVGLIAWEENEDGVEIDRLAVDRPVGAVSTTQLIGEAPLQLIDVPVRGAPTFAGRGVRRPSRESARRRAAIGRGAHRQLCDPVRE